MLNRKALEDAARCNKIYDCDECAMKKNPHDCLEILAEYALAYWDMLERLEWICVGESGEGEDVIICPDCQNEQKEGHKPDCALAAINKAGDKEL